MEVAQKYAPGGVVEPQQVFRPRSGLGSNIEYTYADFLRENGLLDTPEARRMFVRYQQYMASQLESGQLASPRLKQPLLDRPLSQPPTPASAISPPAMESSKITSPDTLKEEAFLGYDLDKSYPAYTSPVAPSLDTVAPIMSRDLAETSPATPALAAEEQAMAEYAGGFAEQYAPLGEDLKRMEDALIEAGQKLIAPKTGPGAVNFPGSEGRAILRGDVPIEDLMPPKPEGVTKPDASDKVLEAEKDFISNIPDDGLRGSDSLITEVEKTTTETGGDAEAVADTVLTNAGVDTKDLSIKEKAIKYKELFSDLFGDSEAEKQELFWLNMAMIGFGIAAGESPSALKNISGGLLAGASEMQKQRATAREREDKLTMLGVETALAEEAEDRRTAAVLDKEARDEAKQLRVYEEKLKLKQQFDPTSPTGLYLGSEMGELVSGIYSDVLTDETLNANEKGAEFIKRAGPENVQKFYTLTGIPPLTTGNQGDGDGASWVDQ
jgi:hypothetical protein